MPGYPAERRLVLQGSLRIAKVNLIPSSAGFLSAITITGERKASMDFTEPVFRGHAAGGIAQGKTLDSTDALRNMKVSVLTGSTGDTVAQKLMGATSTNSKPFASNALALKNWRTRWGRGLHR